MRSFKASGAELKDLQATAKILKASNILLAIHIKSSNAAKDKFAKWLKEKRGLDVETLKIGDQVTIKGVLQIEVTPQNKFDAGAFSLEKPKLFEKYKRDLPVKKFKSLTS